MYKAIAVDHNLLFLTRFDYLFYLCFLSLSFSQYFLSYSRTKREEEQEEVKRVTKLFKKI